jgi:hypothetical protein
MPPRSKIPNSHERLQESRWIRKFMVRAAFKRWHERAQRQRYETNRLLLMEAWSFGAI